MWNMYIEKSCRVVIKVVSAKRKKVRSEVRSKISGYQTTICAEPFCYAAK